MKKTHTTYTVRDLLKGFTFLKDENKGLYGLDGALVIQPAFQRSYIYGDGKRDVAVIESILHSVPMGILSFISRDDGTMEVLDGQQRITSIGRFLNGQFSIQLNGHYYDYSSLDTNVQKAVMDYEIAAVTCTGTETEIKRWFELVNTTGVPLNSQELLNALYDGPFVTAARSKFSRSNNAQNAKWENFAKGPANRQMFLATALKWASDGDVEKYMADHRNDADSSALDNHFDNVLSWVTSHFTVRPGKFQQSVDWGRLYKTYGKEAFKAGDLDALVDKLYAQDDYGRAVQNKKGTFEYALDSLSKSPQLDTSARTRLLEIRIFSQRDSTTAYSQQTAEAKKNGTSNCPMCTDPKIYKIEEMAADHVTAWSKGGSTSLANCQMLCKVHNLQKGNK